MMKQEEAGKKWCPFVRLNKPSAQGGPYNRDGDECCRDLFCIGSDCMMWVWVCRDTDRGHCGMLRP